MADERSAMHSPATSAATDVSSASRLAEMARAENERMAKVRRLQDDFARRGERLAVDMPACYFDMVQRLKAATLRFNQALEPDVQPVRYHETPAVTLREAGPSGDLLVT